MSHGSHIVYVIRSVVYPDRYYTGIRDNVERRLAVHNSGGSQHTMPLRPWVLVAYTVFTNVGSAVAFEQYLKTGSGRAYSYGAPAPHLARQLDLDAIQAHAWRPMMLRSVISAAALLLLLSAPAQAAPINVLLTVNIYAPDYGSSEVGFNFDFFAAASNTWPNDFPSNYLDSVGGSLLSGAAQFSVALEAASLDNVYFSAYGGYILLPVEGEDRIGLIFAHPPDGHVSDASVYYGGPPWIPLANLGAGLSGDLHWFYGYPRTANRSGNVGTWAITPVPEPASMLLLGSGLAAVLAKRYRRR